MPEPGGLGGAVPASLLRLSIEIAIHLYFTMEDCSLPIGLLRKITLIKFGNFLNSPKILKTEYGEFRDWRGLQDQAKLNFKEKSVRGLVPFCSIFPLRGANFSSGFLLQSIWSWKNCRGF